MGQPVKLSDQLVLDARIVGGASERSLAGQIEYWASLGRALEPLLRGDEAHRLKRRGDVQPLSALLRTADSASGRRRLKAVLEAKPFPHFEAANDGSGRLIRIDADGTRRRGRFVRRKFVLDRG